MIVFSQKGAILPDDATVTVAVEFHLDSIEKTRRQIGKIVDNFKLFELAWFVAAYVRPIVVRLFVFIIFFDLNIMIIAKNKYIKLLILPGKRHGTMFICLSETGNVKSNISVKFIQSRSDGL